MLCNNTMLPYSEVRHPMGLSEYPHILPTTYYPHEYHPMSLPTVPTSYPYLPRGTSNYNSTLAPNAPTSNNAESEEGRNTQITLENRELWESFNAIGTEMIVTKPGRRMFPNLRLRFEGLEPKAKYIMLADIVPVDEHRYRYQDLNWTINGRAEPHVANRLYIHPDSPAPGSFWMKKPTVFNKMKITNNLNDKHGHVILNTMQKYKTRVHIVRSNDLNSTNWTTVKTTIFDETEFIAVTAYQSEELTKLKVDNNPFARGFRDNRRTCIGGKRPALADLERDLLSEALPVSKRSRNASTDENELLPTTPPVDLFCPSFVSAHANSFTSDSRADDAVSSPECPAVLSDTGVHNSSTMNSLNVRSQPVDHVCQRAAEAVVMGTDIANTRVDHKTQENTLSVDSLGNMLHLTDSRYHAQTEDQDQIAPTSTLAYTPQDVPQRLSPMTNEFRPPIIQQHDASHQFNFLQRTTQSDTKSIRPTYSPKLDTSPQFDSLSRTTSAHHISFRPSMPPKQELSDQLNLPRGSINSHHMSHIFAQQPFDAATALHQNRHPAFHPWSVNSLAGNHESGHSSAAESPILTQFNLPTFAADRMPLDFDFLGHRALDLPLTKCSYLTAGQVTLPNQNGSNGHVRGVSLMSNN